MPKYQLDISKIKMRQNEKHKNSSVGLTSRLFVSVAISF